MAVPGLPWYGKIESLVAPTDKAASITLFGIAIVCIVIAIFGHWLLKAGFAAYLLSP